MTETTLFNQEFRLKDKLASEIILFWQQGLFASFHGVNAVEIHYAQFIHGKLPNEKVALTKTHCPTIVVVPGRGETYLKYQELIFDLYHQGYNIFIIDHRGQGLSERLLPNINKGYVVNFQDYVDDLKHLIEHIVMKGSPIPPYLLAHSMGGTIALRYMQDSPHAIKAAVISSPMLGFYTSVIPPLIAKKIVTVKLALNKLISNNPWYFLGQKDYCPTCFSKNKLTHSSKRYQVFIDLCKHNKAIQLGGVTTHWIMQGVIAQQNIFDKLTKLKTPILLLQAGSDSIVCQQSQNNFCRKLHALQPQSCPKGEPVSIKGAFHELFFEIDAYRNRAITQSMAWFKAHN
ncbi:MAG: alpha/beta fold hydrolase [Colwellia sp.]